MSLTRVESSSSTWVGTMENPEKRIQRLRMGYIFEKNSTHKNICIQCLWHLKLLHLKCINPIQVRCEYWENSATLFHGYKRLAYGQGYKNHPHVPPIFHYCLLYPWGQVSIYRHWHIFTEVNWAVHVPGNEWNEFIPNTLGRLRGTFRGNSTHQLHNGLISRIIIWPVNCNALSALSTI